MGSKKGKKLQEKWAKKCLGYRKKGRRVGFNHILYNSNAYYANGNVKFLSQEEIAEYENSLTPSTDSFIIH